MLNYSIMGLGPGITTQANAVDIENIDFHCIANFSPNGCNEDNSITQETTTNVDYNTTTNLTNSSFVICKQNSFEGLIAVGCNLVDGDLTADEPPVVES